CRPVCRRFRVSQLLWSHPDDQARSASNVSNNPTETLTRQRIRRGSFHSIVSSQAWLPGKRDTPKREPSSLNRLRRLDTRQGRNTPAASVWVKALGSRPAHVPPRRAERNGQTMYILEARQAI